MKKLALLLSVLILGALGLVACGGGDDDETAAASATETTDDALAANSKSCGAYERWRLAVVRGMSCREARHVIHDYVYQRLPRWLDLRRRGSACGVPSEAGGQGRDQGHSWQRRASSVAKRKLIIKRRGGNEWAPLFAEGGSAPSLCSYMGQPACERMGCERVGNWPIKNCTPVSAGFRESFADATVERVRVQDHYAYAEFTNGESVEFEDKNLYWFITERWIKNAGRR